MARLGTRVAGAVAVALVAAACGDGDGRTSGGGGTRTVEHAMGTTEVSRDPERVVVLDSPQLDAAVALGVQPVGATRTDVSPELPEWIGGLGEVAEVGTIQSPNLEAIAELRPDLILSSEPRHGDLYADLSAIAPTVLAGTIVEEWKDNLVLFADALGRRERAEELLAAYERRAEGLGGRLNAEGAIRVGIVRFLPDEIRIYGPESFSGSVLVDVGVALPGAVSDLTGDIATYPSQEEVGQAGDADALFVTTYGEPADTTGPAVRAGPIWPTLEAVAAGRAFEVSDDTWMLGIGVLGANAILDDIEDSLL